jgi:hypothetical protein
MLPAGFELIIPPSGRRPAPYTACPPGSAKSEMMLELSGQVFHYSSLQAPFTQGQSLSNEVERHQVER